MSIVYWKIVRYPKLSANVWGSGVEIQYFSEPKVAIKIRDGKDSFSFVIKHGSYEFTANDKVDIYRKVGSNVFSDSDLLMTGIVRNIVPKKSGSIKRVVISGYNFSESIMNGLIFVDATNLTPPELFKQGISSLKLASKSFTVEWNNDNPMLKSDNISSFPVVGEKVYNKPFYQVLERYSSKDKTDDGNYYWHVDKDNTLVWKPISQVASSSFSESSASLREFSSSIDVRDVKNFVVVKGGLDSQGRVLQVRYADYSSISRNGFHYYILSDEAKTTDTVQDIDKRDAGVDDMKDASYPFTPFWSSVACTSYNGLLDSTSYVKLLRVYLRSLLKSVGKSFVDDHKYGRLKFSVSVKPEDNVYHPGDLVFCSFIDDGLSDGNMRVEEVNYSTFNDVVVFVQDEGTY